MSDTSVREISGSLIGLANQNMTPKELFKAARKKHPNASKKDIVRGAFRALIDGAEDHPDHAKVLHEMAIGKSPSLNGS